MIKFFIGTVIGFVALQVVYADNLPKHSNQKKLELSSVAETDELLIDANILLPQNHVLNKQAPSAIDIYEQIEGKWQKTIRLPLKDILDFGRGITLQKRIKLKTRKGDLAIDSTLYHCHAVTKTMCVIESFQGKIGRNIDVLTKNVSVKLKGSLP